jgi:hypothetical protein
LEAYRALGDSLRALPKHRLGEDLSAAVLRVAQERQGEVVPAAEPVECESSDRPFAWSTVLRRFAKPKNLLWPIVAAAAAVLMMLNAGRDGQNAPRQRPPVAWNHSGDRNPNAEIGPLPGTEVKPPVENPGAGKADPSKTDSEPKRAALSNEGPPIFRFRVTAEAIQKDLVGQALKKHQLAPLRTIQEDAAPDSRVVQIEFEATKDQIDAVVKELKASQGFTAMPSPRIGPGKQTAPPDASANSKRKATIILEVGKD